MPEPTAPTADPESLNLPNQEETVSSEKSDDSANRTERTLVDGVEEDTLVSTLVSEYQKGRAADSRLQESSELLKANQHKISLGEDLLKARGGDRDALQKVISGMGYSEEDVAKIMEGEGSGAAPEAPLPAIVNVTDEEASERSAFFQAFKAAGMTPQDVATVLTTGIAKQGSLNQTELVSRAVAADKNIATLTKRGVPASTITKMAERVLRDTLRDTGQQLTPQAITAAVQETARNLASVRAGAMSEDDLAIGELAGETYDPGTPTAEQSKMPSSVGDRDAYEAGIMNLLRENMEKAEGTSRA